MAFGHPGCRCQKHPFTNTMVFHFGRTKSGRPGRLRLCNRNRRPSRCAAFRTNISGTVCLPRTALIIEDRLDFDTWSITYRVLLSKLALFWRSPFRATFSKSAYKLRIFLIALVGGTTIFVFIHVLTKGGPVFPRNSLIDYALRPDSRQIASLATGRQKIRRRHIPFGPIASHPFAAIIPADTSNSSHFGYLALAKQTYLSSGYLIR